MPTLVIPDLLLTMVKQFQSANLSDWLDHPWSYVPFLGRLSPGTTGQNLLVISFIDENDVSTILKHGWKGQEYQTRNRIGLKNFKIILWFLNILKWNNWDITVLWLTGGHISNIIKQTIITELYLREWDSRILTTLNDNNYKINSMKITVTISKMCLDPQNHLNWSVLTT